MLNLFQHPKLRQSPSPMKERQPCVYLLASQPRGTVYIGVTSDLPARLDQHRNGVTGGFAGKHEVLHLVRYELFKDMERAILREKQLKRWHREWKLNLIERLNPEWNDLAPGLGIAEPLALEANLDAETSSA